MDGVQIAGLIGSVVLPLWNIPLMVRIVRRKSSKDVSLAWALGVWVCIVLMGPAGLRSDDVVWKTYTIVNFFLFSAAAFTVWKYRNGENCKPE